MEDKMMLDLDGSVKAIYMGETITATNLWFENDVIVVRWCYDDGSDITSELLQEQQEFIWEVINSIKK